MASIHKFDMTSPSFKDNPFPTLAKMRAAGPVIRAKIPILGKIWLVTSYAAVDEMLRDHQRFVRDARNAGQNKFTDWQWWLSRLFRSAADNMLSKDEPDHRRLRSLVDEAFLRRSVESMHDRVQTLADEILDETISKSHDPRRIDFLEFARQFPLAVICELLGFSGEDRAKFTYWARGISTVSSLTGFLMLLPNMFRIGRHFRRQFQLCREQPREGLISLLVQVEEAGDTLSESELQAMAFLLLFAGHETTTHLLATGLLSLQDHPDEKAALTTDWTLAQTAVEEMLRYNSPVQFTKPRIASEDLDFHGQKIGRGDYLIAMLASANSDPARFTDPERFDIRRSPNPHLSFGTGIHVCLGAKLARMEAEIAFERLFTRYPNLQLAVERKDISWSTRIGLRAIQSLPLRLGT